MLVKCPKCSEQGERKSVEIDGQMFGLLYTCQCGWSEADSDPKHDNFREVARGHLKLVRPPKRDFIERFTNQHGYDRDQRVGKLMRGVRDLLDAGLDRDEVDEYMARDDFSRQEIDLMCAALELHSARVKYNNNQVIKYLRALKPKRIWGVR
jgi:hypothetical protein